MYFPLPDYDLSTPNKVEVIVYGKVIDENYSRVLFDNPNLDIEGVLLTMLSVNTNLGLEVISSIKEFFKERVYDTIIPRLIKLAEAPSHGKTILDYDPRGKGSRAYINLAKEVIERNTNHEQTNNV